MAARDSVDPAGRLAEKMAAADSDLLRMMVKTFAEALMSAEADAVCGGAARRVEPGAGQPAQWVSAAGVGYPGWDSRAGDPEASGGQLLPGVTAGTPAAGRAGIGQRRGDQLPAGVSTRRVEKLVEQLGVKRLSRSQVSEMARPRRAGRGVPQPTAGPGAGRLLLRRRADGQGSRRPAGS